MVSYILVANKVDSACGGYIAAREIVERRLAAGRWPLFKNTPHQNEVRPGDRLIVYLAGNKERRFVAVSTAGGVQPSRGYAADGADALTNAPFQQLLLGNAEWLSPEVPIADIKDELIFVPKGTRKWGCVLRRGMKRISESDVATILHHSRGHSAR
jgi:hypothetical protein